MKRVDWLAVLELLWETFEVFSRRDCGWMLAGFKPLPGRHEPYRLLYQLERDGLVTSAGSGATQRFRVTASGVRRLNVIDPRRHWDQPWDKHWRLVSYDLPETRRADRQVLWKALRNRRLGLLQRSLWVWPHDLRALLKELVDSEGVPESFLGFESHQLFLASNAEVVAAAWDWQEITRRQEVYLRNTNIIPRTVQIATDYRALARLARQERDAFQFAFGMDPLLPSELLPSRYQGRHVVQRRAEFRTAWRNRWDQLPDTASTLPGDDRHI